MSRFECQGGRVYAIPARQRTVGRTRLRKVSRHDDPLVRYATTSFLFVKDVLQGTTSVFILGGSRRKNGITGQQKPRSARGSTNITGQQKLRSARGSTNIHHRDYESVVCVEATHLTPDKKGHQLEGFESFLRRLKASQQTESGPRPEGKRRAATNTLLRTP